jgi:hypothetical protein
MYMASGRRQAEGRNSNGTPSRRWKASDGWIFFTHVIFLQDIHQYCLTGLYKNIFKIFLKNRNG